MEEWVSAEINIAPVTESDDLQQALLTRAITAGGAGLAPSTDRKAPDYPGAFSMAEVNSSPGLIDMTAFETAWIGQAAFATNTPAVRPFASTGAELPSVYSQMVEMDFWQSTDTALGRLVARATLSTTTGCLSVLKGRTPMGYVKVYGAHNYGIGEKSADRDHGIMAHKLAYLLLRQQVGLEPTLPVKKQLDHLCRNPACCNPYHLDPISDRLNKQRMAKAHKVENHLANGQVMLGPTGLGWLDGYLAGCQIEDTSIIISTRFGPYRIFKLADDPLVIEGRREPCEVFDNLKAPAPNRYIDKSRAKKHKPLAGEDPIFENHAYIASKPTQQQLYDESIKTG